MKLEEVRDALLGKAGIDVRVDLGDAPRWVHGDERRLMILQFSKGRHLLYKCEVCFYCLCWRRHSG